jgi:sodium-dependent phosphate cotransporter
MILGNGAKIIRSGGSPASRPVKSLPKPSKKFLLLQYAGFFMLRRTVGRTINPPLGTVKRMTEPDLDPQGEGLTLQNRAKATPGRAWLRGLLAIVAVYVFIASVNMIGGGLNIIAKDDAGDRFLTHLFSLVGDNPFMGLFIGLLATAIVQASGFTISMTVGLVASGDLTFQAAIPIVMGANIGTSVTNILVSLAHVRRRMEFRRSLGGAIVHDFFNVLTVLVLFPLEMAFGVISRPVGRIGEWLGHTRWFESDPTKQISFLKDAFNAIESVFEWFVMDVLHFSPTAGGTVIASLAVVILFAALWILVMMLRGLLQERLSGAFNRTLFRRQGISFVVGIVTTATIQSSSVTTSLVVPLVGTGVLKLRQIFPYTLGANIGTTVTAILAALGTGKPAGMACALAHLFFNVYGTAIFWPLQFIPISLAKGFAKLAARRRLIAVAYILGFFFLLPILAIVIMQYLKGR